METIGRKGRPVHRLPNIFTTTTVIIGGVRFYILDRTAIPVEVAGIEAIQRALRALYGAREVGGKSSTGGLGFQYKKFVQKEASTAIGAIR